MKEKKGIRTPLLAADAVILFEGGIVLIQRDRPPYAGCYALPGGFVEIRESVEAAFLARGRGRLQAGSDARATSVFSRERLPSLAFDHEKIIADALALAAALSKEPERQTIKLKYSDGN